MAEFPDHFSERSASYARFRPHYPSFLFEHLHQLSKRHERAWDCATGNGQAALGLSTGFHQVIATDASLEQLHQAARMPNVHYLATLAEQTPFADASMDLITVAQALHWFDRTRFYREVRRVLRPGGIVCAWTYALLRVDPDTDAALDHIYTGLLGDYWPPERRLVDEH